MAGIATYTHLVLCITDVLLQVSTVLQPLVTGDPPPTYFRTDMFTSCFQVILASVI